MENTVLCRLCAIEKDTYVDGYICIYSEEGVKLDLERKIVTCLHIELQPSDALPKVVCLDCCSKLRQCADFLESSEAAQARLIGLLGLQHVKNEETCDFNLPGEAVIKLERGDSSDESPDNRSHSRLHINQGSYNDERESKYESRRNTNASNSGKYSGCIRSRASNKRKCRLPVRVSVEPQLDDDVEGDGRQEATSTATGDGDDDDDDDDEDVDTFEIDDDDEEEDDENDDVVPLDSTINNKGTRRQTSASGKRELRFKIKTRDSEKRRSQGESCRESDSTQETQGGDGGSDSSKEWAEEHESVHGRRRRNELKNYTWMCSDCSEELSDAESLRAHHLIVHKQEPKFMCAQCSKVYTKYHGFLSHVRRHPAYNKFRCDQCGKCFAKQRLLESHRLSHTSSSSGSSSEQTRSHVCAVCGKAFRQQSALYLHSRCHLPEEVKNKYTCDQCHKRFSTKPNLVTHQRIHAGVRNFTCDQCGKSFVQKGNLDAHLLTHSSAKPHLCPMCGKGFKTELQLRKHGSVHTGVKPHQCDICGRQFRERGTLREHHRIHTGAMPFSCEFCGKSFRFKGVLTTHRRQHTGERPYSCLECQHHFTNWPNYNKHMKRRHGINTSRQSRASSGQVSQTGPETVPNTVGTEPCIESGAQQNLTQTSHVQNHPHSNEQSLLHQHSLDVQKQMPVLLSVPEPQPLLHKIPGNSDLSMYHDDSLPSRHEAVEPQPLVHKIPQMYQMHSTHSVQSHVHGTHANVGIHDDVHREQMVRERDTRPAHFYNPAPGQAVNTNPYLHQTQLLQQSIQQSLHQSQLPGLYGLPQLQIDPGHLEMLHSSSQLR